MRVRVSSANLGNDIRDSVTRGVRLSSGDIDREGNRVGNRFANGVGDGIRDGRGRVDRETDVVSRSMTDRITREVNRSRPGLANLFGNNASNMMSKFKQEFNVGIGAARMGPAVISALNLAGPSMISGAGQIAAAMGAEIVSVLGAIGPQIASAIGVGIAAVSTAALNFGLLFAAFKASGDTLDAVKKRLQSVAELIGRPVAEGMLGGLNEAVDKLSANLPQLSDLLREAGKQFGTVASNIATVLTRADNMDRIKGILSTNNTFIAAFGKGLEGLTSSFLILFNAAKPFIDYIGQGIQKFGQWAETSLSAAEASGALAEWMNGMLDTFKQLWETLKDFGTGFKNLFAAAGPVSDKIRDNMADIAKRFKEWTGDPVNQARMTAFFEKAHTIMSAIYDMIGKILTTWGKAFENSNIEPLLHVFQVIGDVIAPAVAKIFNQIQAAVGPQLVQILDNIGTIFTNIADSGAIGKVAGMVADLVLAITDLVAKISENDVGAALLGIGVAALLFGGLIGSLVSVLTTLGGALAALGAPFLAVAAALVFIYTQSQNFRDALGEVATVIKDKLMVVWEWLEPAAERLWEALKRLAEGIGNLLAPVIKALAPVMGVLVTVIGGALVAFIDGLTLFADLLTGVLTGDFTGFVQDVHAIFDPLVPFFDGLWAGITIAWQTTIGHGVDIVISIFQTLWTSAVGIWNTIAAAAETIWTGLVFAWQTWVEPIIGILQTIWLTLTTDLNTFLSATWNLLQGVWTNLVIAWNLWVVPIITTLQTIWTTITSDLAAGLVNIWNILQGVWTTLIVAWQTWVMPIIGILQTIWTTITSDLAAGLVNIWNLIQTVWTSLVILWQSIVQPIIDILSGIWETIKGDAENIWNTIVGIADTTWSDITNAVMGPVIDLMSWLKEKWNDIAADVAAAWSGLQSTVSAIWEGIKFAIVGPIESAWQTLSSIFQSIASAITTVVGAVSSAFDTVNSKYQSMVETTNTANALANQFGATNQGTTAIPTHPGWNDGYFGLAKGGTVAPVPGGRTFVIGEARRPERVEPLDSTGLSRRDHAIFEKMLSAITARTDSSGSTHIYIDGEEIRGMVRNEVRGAESSLAKRINGARAKPA